NYSAPFSLNSVYDYFRNKEKINIAKETLRNYIDILLKAKIIYRCDRFDQKSKKMLKGEYKFYIADMALFFALNTDNRINFGTSLENLVYLYLVSNGYKVSVGKIGKLECDFITRDIYNEYAYIQVSQSVMNQKKEEREYRPFTYIRDGYPRYLLSLDTFRNQRDGIKHFNAIDIFLGKEKI
ncbi:MAG: ATP-binding protein, partial [Erysipelotrichaceae bacterium]|nr:ATP-binding protein [Erysipelotrichaceae bacterium]